MKSLEDINQFLNNFQVESSEKDRERKLPPVHLWQPTEHFSIDMVIKANGEWWYQGNKITREKLVTLFASILVVESDGAKNTYYLKTPVQKAEITVEDAPLLVNDVSITTEQKAQQPKKPTNQSGKNTDYQILFTTTTKDTVTLDKEHQLYFADYKGETRPYVIIRNGLHALISRSVFYHLLEIGDLYEKNGSSILQLCSAGKTFDIEYP